MRVRTYFFPGCFTRPPGTSTRNHPHEPTTSKPVVPWGFMSGSIVERPSAKETPVRVAAVRTLQEALPARPTPPRPPRSAIQSKRLVSPASRAFAACHNQY
jgi:hypothetical protein